MGSDERWEEIGLLEAIYEGGSDVILRMPEAEIDEEIRFEAMVSLDLREPVLLCAAAPPEAPMLLAPLRRSASGECFESPSRLQRLPPLQLRIALPLGYADHGAGEYTPPSFQLSGSWLTGTQLELLCEQLDRLWTENAGEPILFTWLEWLRTESWAQLGLQDKFALSHPVAEDCGRDSSSRTKCEMRDPLESLLAVVAWAESQEQELLQQRPPEFCCNCQAAVPGYLCVPMLSCKHFFCDECATVVVRVHRAADSVARCLAPDCHSLFSDTSLQGFKPGEFRRGAKRVIGTRFAESVVFCPRCESVGEDSPVLTSATCRCYSCHFLFCGTCCSPCHPGEPCLSDPGRAARMLRRRPPLSQAEQERADVAARDGEIRAKEKAMFLGEAAFEFSAFRRRFLDKHEASIRAGLAGVLGAVHLTPAPLSLAVQGEFMSHVRVTGRSVEARPAFHGTNVANHTSIFARGLLVPGEGNELTVVHGTAHGRGIYTANVDAAWLSRGFCSQPCMLVCAVLQLGCVRFAGDAMVVSDRSHVAPLFEARGDGFADICPAMPKAAVASPSGAPSATAARGSVPAAAAKLGVGLPKASKKKATFLERYARKTRR